MTLPAPFGRYQLLERIGVGGMAELFLATISGPSGFRKTVAIKKMLPELKDQARYREMFLHEGRLMGALNHRNLVQVFELGEVDGELFLSLEYVPGRSLAQVLRTQQERGTLLVPELAAWIGRELCQGLHAMHSLVDERGQPMHVVHRDVNPHNLMLSRHGDVKLGDFGIAKSLADDPRTQQGQIKGKLQYLAPEQARGEPVAPTTDVYASGLVLFEMLSGERYLQGENDAELLVRASMPRWRPLRPLNPEVSEQLEQVVERALRPAPELRFATTRALATALDETIALSPRPPTADDVAALVGVTPGDGAADELRTLDPASIIDVRSDGSIAQVAAGPVSEPASANATSTISIATPAPRRSKVGLLALLAVLLTGSAIAVVALNATGWQPFASTNAHDASETWTIDVVLPAGRDAAAADAAPAAADATQVTTDAGAREPVRPGRNPTKQRTPRSTPEERGRPGDTTGAALQSLQRELSSQRARFHERGLRPGDVPALDTLVQRVERALQARQAEQARLQLQQLTTAIDGAAIDRGLVERKMVRLQRALERAGRAGEYDAQRRRVLELALENRFVEANTALNRMLDQLGVR